MFFICVWFSVTEFSKKTGDYSSLSATDIKVIALTYQLEKEKVGSDHLRSAPETQKTISFQNRPTVDLKDIAGFYIPTAKVLIYFLNIFVML